MPVRPFADNPKSEKALNFFKNKPIGIKKTAPTQGSKTQRRKANKANHMRSNTAGMR